MLLGQELKFKNKLCNLKLGTFFSALTGHFTGFIGETGGNIFQEGFAAQVYLGAGGRLCP